MLFTWKSKAELKIDKLIALLLEWRKEDMANWNDLAARILELKQETVRVFEVLDKVRGELDAALRADALDQDEVQKAHDAIAGVVADMDHKIHADGV